MNLVLIGYRGSGKTTAGAALARRLKLRFKDSDDEIVKRAGKSIEEIFSEDGEPAFRALERAVMLDLLDESGLVLGTGGGAILDPQVREKMKTHAVVLLTADPSVLAGRIAGTDRPSLTGADPAEEVEKVLAGRMALYNECADLCLDTGEKSIKETLHELEQFWSSL